MAKQKEERKLLITPEFRASFPALFEARKVNGQDPSEKAKFSVVMLFRTGETPESKAAGEKVVDLRKPTQPGQPAMYDEVARICEAHLGADWKSKIGAKKGDGSPMYRLPFRDGAADDCKTADGKYKEGFGPGIVYVRSSSEYKPGVVDAQNVEVMNPQDVYGGCYMRAQVHFYWYNTKGNQGVSCCLDNVQKVRDGVPFSGRMKAADAFGAIEQPTGAVPAGASSDALMP